MSKRKILLCLFFVFVFLGVVLLSFFFVKFFSTPNDSTEIVKKVNIVLSKDKKIYLSDQTPQKNNDNVEGYTFSVSNDNNVPVKYNVLLDEKVDSSETEKEILGREYMSYSLILNDKEIISDSLDKIDNNILDTRVIDANSTNNYILKIGLSNKDTSNQWMNKYYYYAVTIDTLSE